MRTVVTDPASGPGCATAPPSPHAASTWSTSRTTAPTAAPTRCASGCAARTRTWGLLRRRAAPALGPDFTLLQITAAGTDHVALDALPTRVTVANAHGHGRSIAEHVLMTVLAVHRQLLWRDAELRRAAGTPAGGPGRAPVRHPARNGGRHRRPRAHRPGRRPAVRRGRHAARRRTALRAGRDTTDPDLEWIDGIGALDELLDACRVLVLTCPLTEETGA
ncbi:hypothetical protein NKH77_10980 [Streptomyces sp. M19]